MSTDYIKQGKKTGDDRFKGFSCYKVSKDKNGNLHSSPKYVSFDYEVLCGEYTSEKAASEGFLNNERHPDNIRKADYKGLEKG